MIPLPCSEHQRAGWHHPLPQKLPPPRATSNPEGHAEQCFAAHGACWRLHSPALWILLSLLPPGALLSWFTFPLGLLCLESNSPPSAPHHHIFFSSAFILTISSFFPFCFPPGQRKGSLDPALGICFSLCSDWFTHRHVIGQAKPSQRDSVLGLLLKLLRTFFDCWLQVRGWNRGWSLPQDHSVQRTCLRVRPTQEKDEKRIRKSPDDIV